MPSSFKSLDLFGSGPHRFALGPEGQALQSELFLPTPASGSLYVARNAGRGLPALGYDG